MNTPLALALNNVDLLKHALYKDYQFPEEINTINRTQERILMTVKYSHNLTMVTIARAIGLEKGPFSQSVDKLEELELLCRHRSETDKRNIHLRLTTKGEVLTAIIENSMEKHFESSMSKLTAEQKNAFLQALETLKQIASIINKK